MEQENLDVLLGQHLFSFCLGALKVRECFRVVAQVRVFDSDGAHDLNNFRLIEVRAHGFLLEVLEI